MSRTGAWYRRENGRAVRESGRRSLAACMGATACTHRSLHASWSLIAVRHRPSSRRRGEYRYCNTRNVYDVGNAYTHEELRFERPRPRGIVHRKAFATVKRRVVLSMKRVETARKLLWSRSEGGRPRSASIARR
eukprot:405296-Prymnesium_polylepis.1